MLRACRQAQFAQYAVFPLEGEFPVGRPDGQCFGEAGQRTTAALYAPLLTEDDFVRDEGCSYPLGGKEFKCLCDVPFRSAELREHGPGQSRRHLRLDDIDAYVETFYQVVYYRFVARALRERQHIFPFHVFSYFNGFFRVLRVFAVSWS